MAKILSSDEIALPTAIEASWSPVVGDLTALELGSARFLRTDETSWTLSLDAVGAGAEAAVIVLEQARTTGDAGITSITRTHDAESAFPEINGQIQFDPRERIVIALHTLGSAAADSASITVSFGGTGDVAFDVHAIELMRQWSIPEGVDTDWALSYVDQSQVDDSDAGSVFATRRRVLRELSVSLRNREEAEIFLPDAGAGIMRILRSIGRSRQIMLIPRELSEPMDAQAAVAGRIRSDPEISHVDGPFFTITGLRIREAL